MSKTLSLSFDNFYEKIKEILEIARARAYQSVNFEMVNAYWHIAREILEVEQKGKERAEYGQNLLNSLSERLTADYGKGFNSRNLTYMRQFYQNFPNLNALRSELSWTHYRILMRIEKDAARE